MDIAKLVRECLSMFRALEDGRRSGSRELKHEHQRFRVWTGNLSAHRPSGSRSLEFRLRDAQNLRKRVVDLLQSLLVELHGCTTGGNDREPESESDNELDSLGIVYDDLATDEQTPLENVHDVVSLLYRFSQTLRHPAAHTRNRENLRITTVETQPFDVAHVREKYSNADLNLATRLGRGISARRQWINYRQEHRKRKAAGLDDEVLDDDRRATTVATSLPQELKDRLAPQAMDIDTYDNESIGSVTSYAPTESEASISRIPTLPATGADGEPFECPICCTITMCGGSSQYQRKKTWLRHIFLDLRPYMCTSAQCTSADKLFPRRREWEQHMQSCHQKLWICPDCGASRSESDWMLDHLVQSHGYRHEYSTLWHIVDSCSVPNEQAMDLNCPLCGKVCSSAKRWFRHVGHHQEQVALFSLPLHLFSTDASEELGDMSNEEEVSNNENFSNDGDASNDEDMLDGEDASPSEQQILAQLQQAQHQGQGVADVSWSSRFGNLGRFSPFTRSPPQGFTQGSDSEFTYITADDLRRHQEESANSYADAEDTGPPAATMADGEREEQEPNSDFASWRTAQREAQSRDLSRESRRKEEDDEESIQRRIDELLAQGKEFLSDDTVREKHDNELPAKLEIKDDESKARQKAAERDRPGSIEPESSRKYLGISEVAGEGTFHMYEGGFRIPTSIDGELVNPTWGLTKANKPRKRLAMACLECRERKLKCEPGASRCLQCEKAKRLCTKAPIHQAPTRPSVGPTRDVSGGNMSDREDNEDAQSEAETEMPEFTRNRYQGQTLMAQQNEAATRSTEADTQRQPAKSRHEIARQWFVPGEGIDRHVIAADIQRYLGNDATVRPGVGTGEYQGVQGYWIKAYRNLTAAMIGDLRTDSARWRQEQRQAGTREPYVGSSTFHASMAGRTSTRRAGDPPPVDGPYGISTSSTDGTQHQQDEQMSGFDETPYDPSYPQSDDGAPLGYIRQGNYFVPKESLVIAEEDGTVAHRKLYSVTNDGSARLVADVNIPVEGLPSSLHKRRA